MSRRDEMWVKKGISQNPRAVGTQCVFDAKGYIHIAPHAVPTAQGHWLDLGFYPYDVPTGRIINPEAFSLNDISVINSTLIQQYLPAFRDEMNRCNLQSMQQVMG